MITSSSYFNGSILIENIESIHPNSEELGLESKLDAFIQEYEPDVLIKCFGYSLYKEFMDQFSGDYTLKGSADQKWDDLLNGKEYQVNGINYYWRGLIYVEGGLKRSLISFYIFSKYIKRDFLGVGIQSQKTKETIPNPSLIYVEAYNDFVNLTVKGKNGLVSLYQFLTDMNTISSDTYANWSPTNFCKINQFSI
ncbi:structural protein [Polaribacter phage Freya_1]|uniref:Structural protein n=1 Tax=Polaribacter phage Freya_1 TaxID=2745662 RepID=A0A8E4ZLK8_9CAUD|nr:structural protein [Polaribacter phage Freya_1]QQV90638.1 structural protein [Polaribacter phage Danklef_2]QQV90792.1 structural protein [Polaribacter phage Danklef_4]QQV90955.1 structural protein [Polaribacter phage Freya_2]QQV91023.1 structural protein [Polaribacter phage Freya_3]QQV91091.1 structural protein [Polaribacter phage Freya_4]QQV91166.1 structural protein [Polaribacter phage Freya_8]QQV91243.1 structural protein [Polaribacter phage Freya_9]QQV91321.1 structural protein [Pola